MSNNFDFVDLLPFVSHAAINQMIADFEAAINQDGGEFAYPVPREIYKAHKIAVDYMRRTWPWHCNDYQDVAVPPAQPNNGINRTDEAVQLAQGALI